MDEAIKNLYRKGALVVAKAYFPLLDLTLENEIIEETPELIESIMNDDNIKFGACVASQFSFIVSDVMQDVAGLEFIYTHTIGEYTVPIGIYKVASCEKQGDENLKRIMAYDRMTKIDTDATSWYNSLTFPLTLSAFRSSFLSYVGLEEDITAPLSNDSMTVEKTIQPTQLSGRVVIEACEEINGCFGHINRSGKFTHVVLGEAYTDYPQEDYPSDDDYPTEEPYEQIETSMYVQNGVKFEEYTVKAIDKLQIRQEEGDIGLIYGTGDNAYIINGNFLLYGKSAAELEVIAANASKNIFNREYRPYTADLIGLPYVEVGDMVKYHTSDMVAGYVLSRTLKGIQALRDTFEAPGSEVQAQSFGLGYEIQQLKGKTAKIVKSVDEVSVTLSDLAEATESQFVQTDDKITAEVSRAKGKEDELSSSIDMIAGSIVLKVNANGEIAAVELDADPSAGTSIKIKAQNISLEGLITANNNFKVNLDGSIEAANGKFSGDISASNISGSEFVNVNANSTEMASIKDGIFEGTSFHAITMDGAEGAEYKVSNITAGTLFIQYGGESTPTTILGGVVTSGTVNANEMYVLGDAVITDGTIGTKTCYMAQSCYYLPSNWAYALKLNIDYLYNFVEQTKRTPWPAD